jgi:hypothetical protein
LFFTFFKKQKINFEKSFFKKQKINFEKSFFKKQKINFEKTFFKIKRKKSVSQYCETLKNKKS